MVHLKATYNSTMYQVKQKWDYKLCCCKEGATIICLHTDDTKQYTFYFIFLSYACDADGDYAIPKAEGGADYNFTKCLPRGILRHAVFPNNIY